MLSFSMRIRLVAAHRSRCVSLPVVYQPRHRPSSRKISCETSKSDNQASDKAFIKSGVDRAASLIDAMLEEIMRELFAESAARYISPVDNDKASESLDEEEVVRKCVMRRLEFLDANFLGSVTGYIDMFKKNLSARKTDEDFEQEGMLSLLELIRTQVLYQVALRLPPSARVLNRVLRDEDKDSRLSVLRETMSGGQGDLPGSDSESLVAAASQFIEDMEDAEVIIDRRLLARLCLVREEVRWIADERAFTSGESSSPNKATSGPLTDDPIAVSDPSTSGEGDVPRPVMRTNVPQRSAAFINQLVSVTDPSMRVALMSRAFCEDWDGAAPRQKPQTAAQKGQPDFVRPGRFMSALHLMMIRMDQEGIEEEKRGSIMRRLADIQMEAINVLDRMQRGELVATQAKTF